jgi:hypothetical protein
MDLFNQLAGQFQSFLRFFLHLSGRKILRRCRVLRLEQQILRLPGKGGYSTRPPVWVEVCVAFVTILRLFIIEKL